MYETRRLISFLLGMNIKLQITHVPEVRIVTAHALSRINMSGGHGLTWEIRSGGNGLEVTDWEVTWKVTD
jgi:hypothetical protein